MWFEHVCRDAAENAALLTSCVAATLNGVQSHDIDTWLLGLSQVNPDMPRLVEEDTFKVYITLSCDWSFPLSLSMARLEPCVPFRVQAWKRWAEGHIDLC